MSDYITRLMTLKGGTSNACAACKYQRRKCTPECQLAPYFPADKPDVFKNAHKLFGVKNILSILKTLHDPTQKEEAMKSIICQANIREMFPVHGCCQVIDLYWSQIRQLEEELHVVYSQLEFYRAQQPNNQDANTAPSQLDLGMAPPNNTNLQLPYSEALPLASLPPPPPHQSYSNGTVLPITNNNNNATSPPPNSYLDSKENISNPSFWIQSSYTNTNPNPNLNPVQPAQLAGPTVVPIQHAHLAVHGMIQDYEDMHPFFDSVDDQQSYIGSKDACDSSSESSLKDMTSQSKEHVAENELKSAAACFSLTSIN